MVVEALAVRGVLGGVPVSRLIPDGGFENYLLVAATETCAPEDMAAYAAALEEVLS
jgi:glycine dehydrogenase subunit 1